MTRRSNLAVAALGGACALALVLGAAQMEASAQAPQAPAAVAPVPPVESPPLSADLMKERVDALILRMTSGTDPDIKVVSEGLTATEVRDGAVTAITPRLTFTITETEVTIPAVADPSVAPEAADADKTDKTDVPAKTTVTSFVVPQMRLTLSKQSDTHIAFQMTAPDRIDVTVDGAPAGGVVIGRQSMSGSWVPAFESYDRLDVRLGDIVFSGGSDPANAGTARIGEVAMTGVLTETVPGLYDGTYDFRITGVSGEGRTDNVQSRFAMDDLAFTFIGQQMRMAELGAAAREAGYTLSNPRYMDLMFQSEPEVDPKMVAFLKAIPSYIGGLVYTVGMRGLRSDEGGEAVNLADLSGKFGVAGEDGGKARMTFGFSVTSDGLGELMDMPKEAGIRTAAVEFDVGGLPGKQVWDTWMGAIVPAVAAAQAQPTQEQQQQAVEDSLAAQEEKLTADTMAALQAATITFGLKRFELSGGAFRVTGTGQGTYQPSGAGMPVGTAEFRAEGLAPLMTALQPKAADDAAAASFVETFGMFQAIGVADPATPTDNPAYVIKFEALPDGNMLANGQPLGGGMSEPMPAEEPAPETPAP